MEWQNVWAECMNRTLLEVVRSMLSGAKLPHTHFGQKHCQRQLTYRTGVLPKLSKEWHHMKPGRERNLQLIICEHSPMCMYQRMKERSSTQSQKDAFCWAMEQGKKVIGCTISRNRRFFQQRCCLQWTWVCVWEECIGPGRTTKRSKSSRKQVFKAKVEADRSVEQYKAHFIAQGFSNKYGLDYDKTFSPCHEIRVHSYSDCPCCSEWFEVASDGRHHSISKWWIRWSRLHEIAWRVYCWRSGAFGLPIEAKYLWLETISKMLESDTGHRNVGFVQSTSDPCIYTSTRCVCWRHCCSWEVRAGNSKS